MMRGGGGAGVRGVVGAGAGAGAGCSGVGPSVNETTLGGHPPDAEADADADDDIEDNDDKAGGFFRPGDRPTMSRRAASARLYDRSP